MDPLKKRKMETGAVAPDMLSIDDARRILDSLDHDQLMEIVQNALLRHPDVLDAVRSIADRDTAQRKLFIRGLGWETTTEKLRALFSSYGELDEAVVILDKVTGKSKGYGFVTFKHIDGAIMALKEPSKKIDGRITVTQLAAAGVSGGGGGPAVGTGTGGMNTTSDVSTRKIYVSNVPYDMAADGLLQHFSMYGEIEEGPLGFDKATGKSKGFALFVYKTADAARASLVEPVKNIDGHQLNCKLAIDGKRGKPNGDGVGVPMPIGVYGGHYGGFSGGAGGRGLPYVRSQASGSNHGINGGYGPVMGGGMYVGGSHVGGPTGIGYGGGYGSGAGSGVGSGAGLGVGGGGFSGHGGGLGGSGGAAASGMGAAGRGSSMYGMPPSSVGMGTGDYSQSSHYNISSGSSYQGQHNQIPPRIPPGGAYEGIPPYY